MPLAWVGFVAFMTVGGLTEFVRRLAVKLALTDRPGARKGHQHPTPYLGGVVIVVGVLGPAAVAVGGGDMRVRGVLGAAAAIALLGLVDDLRPLSPSFRLFVEGLAASLVVAA